jgi:hypothetical protein
VDRKNLTRTQTQTLTPTEPTRTTHRTKTSRPDANPGAQRPSADMPEAPPHPTTTDNAPTRKPKPQPRPRPRPRPQHKCQTPAPAST